MLQKIKWAVRATDGALGLFGISPLKTIRTLRGTLPFVRDLMTFKKMMREGNEWPLGRLVPMLEDRNVQSGKIGGHYFHQDLLVARRIHARNPRRHIDVGSRIDGFVAHVASFRQIELIDIRPMDASIPNVKFMRMDLMDDPRPDSVAICDSLSCLHVLEHFGLGRYGDRIDPYGYEIGFDNLLSMLEPGGVLYFSVPMGRQRVEFNSLRFFSLSFLLKMFTDRNLGVISFSYVDDNGNLQESVPITSNEVAIADALNDGCGIFELRKLEPA